MSSSPTIHTSNLYNEDDSPNEELYKTNSSPDIGIVSQSQTIDPFNLLSSAPNSRVILDLLKIILIHHILDKIAQQSREIRSIIVILFISFQTNISPV